jgi:Tfp pilus assembly protein PilN
VRPVNLVPPEQRRGERAPTRRGPAAYGVVAILGIALVAITAIVLTNNTVSDRKAEVAVLEQQEAEATEFADSLSSYSEFASLEQKRVATVTTLAESRFDWERVLRELAVVIPDGVWLTTLTGTVRPDIQLAEASGNSLRQQVAGPALEMSGCGLSHEAVAEFVAALEDIDGVTRIVVNRSERPTGQSSGATAATEGSGCGEAESAAQFDALAAFDEVPVTAPTTTPGAPAEPAAPAEEDASQVSDATTQQDQARDSAGRQTEKGRDAANLIPGTVR